MTYLPTHCVLFFCALLLCLDISCPYCGVVVAVCVFIFFLALNFNVESALKNKNTNWKQEELQGGDQLDGHLRQCDSCSQIQEQLLLFLSSCACSLLH